MIIDIEIRIHSKYYVHMSMPMIRKIQTWLYNQGVETRRVSYDDTFAKLHFLLYCPMERDSAKLREGIEKMIFEYFQ